VKCRTQNCCSPSAGGTSLLHPVIWQDLPMEPLALNDRVPLSRGKSSAHRANGANLTWPAPFTSRAVVLRPGPEIFVKPIDRSMQSHV
jgi:hypothetical protein